ncbi:MAG TPA: hypothetical protein VMZ90_07455 [Vicinamibacterales bacterium]|nr:hypothetical protein [Vicinamibacterales bacterium]
MTRKLLILLGFVTLTITACSETPLSPADAAAGTTSSLAAKPGGGGTPVSSPHALSFSQSIYDTTQPPNGFDGYPSPGHIEGSGAASGWITLISGKFAASATSAAYTMTFTDLDELPDDAAGGDPCTEGEQQFLRNAGVMGPGTSVTGRFSTTLGEEKLGKSLRYVQNWALADVPGGAGVVWQISGRSGSTNPLFFPQIGAGSTATALTVTTENGRADFKRFFNGTQTHVMACRTDFTMTMTKQ